jgi:hypothetical protein
MDLQLANTESFLQFHDFLEGLDRNLKVSFGALALVRSLPPNSVSKAGNQIIQLPTESEPWGPHTKWLNLESVVSDSQRFIAEIGLMQMFSAFEDFLNGTKAEFDRAEAVLHGRTSTAVKSEVRDIGLRKLCATIGLSLTEIDGALPLFDYFLCVRNCLAHRGGKANQELVNISHCSALLNAIAGWPLRKGATLPQLPQVARGKRIALLARHAIYAGFVCRTIGKVINDHLVGYLGEKGMVLMATHHALFVDEPIIRAKRRDGEAIVNDFLCARYRVRMDGNHEAQKILRGMGRWQATKDNYKRLYGQNVQDPSQMR